MKEAILKRMYKRIHVKFKSRHYQFMALEVMADFLEDCGG